MNVIKKYPKKEYYYIIFSDCSIFNIQDFLIENGLDKVTIRVGGENFTIIKAFFCCNELLYNIIKENKNDKAIKLSSVCTKVGFKSLRTYYGYSVVIIDENNIIDIIRICECYNEKDLLKECIKYIRRHFIFDIVLKLINNNSILEYKDLLGIKNDVLSYISEFGNDIFDESIMIIINR